MLSMGSLAVEFDPRLVPALTGGTTLRAKQEGGVCGCCVE